jgi:hypothetical protein
MPISFLDLPRELRDLIYVHCLESPTGHIIAHLHKSREASSKASSKQHLRGPLKYPRGPPKFSLHLQLQPCDARTLAPVPAALPLAVALMSTCRQIHSETAGILWSRNVLCLEAPESAIQVFKHMGQSASRMVQRVRLYVKAKAGAFREEKLAKSMSMLASRARRGNLHELDVVLMYDVRKEMQPWDMQAGGDGLIATEARWLAEISSLELGDLAVLGWGPVGKLRRRVVCLDASPPKNLASFTYLSTFAFEVLGIGLTNRWEGKAL